MFDKLIEFLLNIIEDIMPVFFVKQYNNGILLRMGKFVRVVKPGVVFKIPFLDKVEITTIVTTTLSVPTQSVITKDKKQLVVKSVVKYKIADVELFMLNVYDSTDAISDITQAIIKEQISLRTFEECTDNDFDNTVTKKLRVEMKKWGIEVDRVTLTDIGQIKSLRLFNEGALIG
jgi:regulator of protease activity HflC (stomatin/prohibitin superfamily)